MDAKGANPAQFPRSDESGHWKERVSVGVRANSENASDVGSPLTDEPF